MYKIAITGKANTGKDTVSKLLVNGIDCVDNSFIRREPQFIAFADPIKKMAHLLFPEIPRKWLYGSSKYRSEVILGAFKDGVPLTVRQLLIDLGSELGRKYKPDIWLRNFDRAYNRALKKKAEIIVVTDCRFRNEFDHLKSLGFFEVRILRDAHAKINDASETNQDGILDSEFDAVIYNNGTKEQLKEQVGMLVVKLTRHLRL
jgi:hypothetical protein